MDLKIGAISIVDGHGRKIKGPGITADLLQEDQDGERCPRDRGFLAVAEGEDFIVRRCVNCGWRKYSALGKLVAKISQERAMGELVSSDQRIKAIEATRRGRRDGRE